MFLKGRGVERQLLLLYMSFQNSVLECARRIIEEKLRFPLIRAQFPPSLQRHWAVLDILSSDLQHPTTVVLFPTASGTVQLC